MMEPSPKINTKRFQVALSFTGEYRNFVEGVAKQLSRNLGQNQVFYDRYYEAELARPNLDTHLINIYREDTDLIAIFLCSNYTKKKWCGLEWRAIRDVLKRRHSSESMFFKFDDVKIEGLISIDSYIDIGNRTPEEVAYLILQHVKDTSSLPSAESNLSVGYDEVELVLDVDFEAFTPEREQRFLRALSLLLNDSNVRISRKRPGNSTVLTLTLTSQQCNILKNVIERRELAEFKPKVLLVNDVSFIDHKASIMALSISSASPKVADTMIKAKTVKFELTIDHDFDLFSAEDESRVLHTLRELLDLSDEISIVAIEPGSTKVTVILPPEHAEQLLWLYERGVLDQLNIKDAKIIGSAAADAIVRNKSQSNSYDVFMCHNSMDKPEVKRIALRLRSRGILPWLDEWELRPGLPWQRALEEQIRIIKSAAVFVGNSGIGPWQDMEMNALIRQFVQRQCPVIPVILKKCPGVPTLPSFLDGMTWVNFKKGKPNPYDQLIWGVTGKKL